MEHHPAQIIVRLEYNLPLAKLIKFGLFPTLVHPWCESTQDLQMHTLFFNSGGTFSLSSIGIFAYLHQQSPLPAPQ
jgi:hypothetical protein